MTVAEQRDLLAWAEERRMKPLTIEERFLSFHARHPEVYSALVRLARQARAVRDRRIGIGQLFEVLRWERHLEGLPCEGEDFKLNNNYRSRYARLIAEREPDLVDAFETRELRAL